MWCFPFGRLSELQIQEMRRSHPAGLTDRRQAGDENAVTGSETDKMDEGGSDTDERDSEIYGSESGGENLERRQNGRIGISLVCKPPNQHNW